jgi:hypothetical protein
MTMVRILGWGGAALLLLLPLVAMQFSAEVNWTAFDFAFAAGLMLVVGGALELTVRLTANGAYRAGIGAALASAFLLIWLTGAVGIIGSEREPANLLYLALLAGALVGAVVVRFRARHMAVVMLCAALAQAGIGVTALAAGWGAADPGYPADIVGLTGFFTALWLAAAWLFRKAAARNRS